MKQRIVSAIFFVVAMLAGVFGGPVSFYILFAIIGGGCLWELMGLLFSKDSEHLLLRKVTGVVLGSLPFLVFGSKIFGIFQSGLATGQFTVWVFTSNLETDANPMLLSLLLLLCALFALFIVELFLRSVQPFAALGYYLLGVVYVSIPYTLLVSIAFWQGDYAPMRVFGLMLLIWANDTMAYLTGSQLGRTPLFPRISPKKTWEGTIGGSLCTFVLAWLLSHWVTAFTLPQWVALAGCAAVFGTLGDLVESMLKRSVDKKDSGDILPGHGGFLDRFDAFMFALPFAWMALMVLEG